MTAPEWEYGRRVVRMGSADWNCSKPERVALTTQVRIRAKRTSLLVLLLATHFALFTLGLAMGLFFSLADVPQPKARPAYWIHR